MPSGRRGVNRAQVRARNGAQGARRGDARGARHGDFADHVTRTAGQSEREAAGALVGGQRMRGAAAGDRASGAVGTCQHRSRLSRCGCWGGLIVLLWCCVLRVSLFLRAVMCCVSRWRVVAPHRVPPRKWCSSVHGTLSSFACSSVSAWRLGMSSCASTEVLGNGNMYLSDVPVTSNDVY